MSDPGIEFGGCFAGAGPARSRAPLVLIGLPDDTRSSFRRGCARGPSALRKAYDGACYNTTTEAGMDLAGLVLDAGDLTPGATWAETRARFRDGIRPWIEKGKLPFLVGGDHGVTVPAVEAFRALGTGLHVVQIDAHGDLYPEFEGSRDSHACTGARLLEMDHVASLTQIGVRTLNAPQEACARKFADRLKIVSAREFQADSDPTRWIGPLNGKPVYLTLDLDGLDPAHAPGVSHPVPGGLTSRQVLDLLLAAQFRLVGMDVVELNPSLDVRDLTAILAGRLLHEAMGVALRPDPPGTGGSAGRR